MWEINDLNELDELTLMNTAANLVAMEKSRMDYPNYLLYLWEDSVPGVLLSDGYFHDFCAMKLRKTHPAFSNEESNTAGILYFDDNYSGVILFRNTLFSFIDENEPKNGVLPFDLLVENLAEELEKAGSKEELPDFHKISDKTVD